jgi:hypothetical protein
VIQERDAFKNENDELKKDVIKAEETNGELVEHLLSLKEKFKELVVE